MSNQDNTVFSEAIVDEKSSMVSNNLASLGLF